MRERHGHWAIWVVPAIYAGCLAAFIADLTSTNTLAFGVFYAPLVATAVFYSNRNAVWVLTGIACAMNVVGAFFPDVAKNVTELAENRGLSILALLATGAFTWHARSIQERLAEQTRRAEAAESIKTEVLDNITQEIRGPLQATIGVLNLAAANCPPEQRAALEMVRMSTRRLVLTIDNLVDLTRSDEPAPPIEPVDLSGLLKVTTEARRQDAAARQIRLTLAPLDDGKLMVSANVWALRRILENKLADAITYTAPGGRIEIAAESDADADACAVVIQATGSWPPAALQLASDPMSMLLTPSAMGLALSHRLARAIGARLEFSSGPGVGTTIRLQMKRARPAPRETHALSTAIPD